RSTSCDQTSSTPFGRWAAPEPRRWSSWPHSRWRSARIPRSSPWTIYEPYVKQPQRQMTFAVRTAGDPERLAGSIRDAVAAVDPSVPLFDFCSQHTQIVLAILQDLLFAYLVSGFGLLSLLLAC